MDARELFKFNEWWDTGKVSDKNLEGYRRYLFPEMLKFAEDKQILLLRGLRRIGKTTLLYQLIQELLERSIDKRNILYFSFDEEEFGIKDVLETYQREVLRRDFKDAGRVYMFLDEVQKTGRWENKIKVYYDLYPGIKFFLSGSAALILSKKSKESLAGRIYEFEMLPLTFREFLDMKKISVSFADAKLLNEKIMPYFADFLIKSGFPEIVNEEDEEKIRAYVKLSVIDRIIYRDVPTEFGRTDIDLLEKLTNLFLKNPGSILNFENLARDFQRNKRTLMNYVYYLRFSLLINLVSNLRISVLAASRKNRKVYPATTSMIFSLSGRFSPQLYGTVLETVVASELSARNYFGKAGREIDFLIMKGEKARAHLDRPRFAGRNNYYGASQRLMEEALIPVEIRHNLSGIETKKYCWLLNKLGFKKGLMLTMDEFGGLTGQGVKVSIYPVWAFIMFSDEILKNI